MNTDETQINLDRHDRSLQSVTQELIVYQRSMQVELTNRKIKVELEPKITVRFKGVTVGEYLADLLVADQIVVELKTDPDYQPAHEAQLLNELRGTGIRLGFLINFGRERVEYKRMVF